MPAESRRRRLRAALDAAEVDGLIVSSPTNVGYLTGFTGEDAVLAITGERAILVSDGRFTLQLEQECPPALEVDHSQPSASPWPWRSGGLSSRSGGRRWGFESQATTVAEFDALRGAAEGVELVPRRGLVERLRMIKDEAEIALIREAVAIAERAFLDLRGRLRPGMTEKAAADFLENALRSRGATASSFAPIVAVGPRAARCPMPEAHGRNDVGNRWPRPDRLGGPGQWPAMPAT